MAEMLADAEDELGRIDAVAGDGDHGRGMVKGSSAAASRRGRRRVEDGAGQGSVLTAAGKAWAAKAGGTSGVLWGAMLTALGARLGDTGRPDRPPRRRNARRLRRADSARRRGAGDKTMLDALLPFVEELERRVADGEPWQTAWRAAADVATEAARATADLRPKVGRARPLAERSVGTPDAGATSLAMCAHTVADASRSPRKGTTE